MLLILSLSVPSNKCATTTGIVAATTGHLLILRACIITDALQLVIVIFFFFSGKDRKTASWCSDVRDAGMSPPGGLHSLGEFSK